MQNTDEMKTQTPIPGHLPRECGWTLIELLIGITVTLGVMLAALPIIDGAANTEGRVQQAALSIGDARAFSEQVLRDLRSATDFPVGYPRNSTTLTVNTYVRHACGSGTPSAEDAAATPCTVTYSCSAGSCTRQESGGPSVTAFSGLRSDDVFTYPPTTCDNVCFVSITLELPNYQNAGGDAITLQDGTALRNVGI